MEWNGSFYTFPDQPLSHNCMLDKFHKSPGKMKMPSKSNADYYPGTDEPGLRIQCLLRFEAIICDVIKRQSLAQLH